MTKEEILELKAMMKEVVGEELKPIQEDIGFLKTEVSKINATIEHKIDRSIKITMEGHTDLNLKLDKTLGIERRVETVENKVSAIEYTMKKAE